MDLPLDGDADVCIYVLARNSGEGADRKDVEGDFRLTKTEVRDILACARSYQHFLLVLNVGGPVDLSPVLDAVDNVLLLGQLGSVTGQALADVVLGRSYPSGRLAATWAASGDYQDVGDFAEPDDTEYREGIFVGYRYFDAVSRTPLFPFGYGLGYTDFKTTVSGFSLEGTRVVVTAKVENTGSRAGKRAVGLFWSAPQGRLVKPVRELGRFAKTSELLPGEGEELVLSLPAEDMASWDDEADAWVLEKGDYLFFVDDAPAGAVSLDRTVICEHLGHFGGDSLHKDWEPAVTREIPDGLQRLQLDAELLVEKGHADEGRIDSPQLKRPDLSGFSDEELARCCCGKHSAEQKMASMIGNSSSRLAGGAGESAELISQKGMGALLMADGPAGLRLATRYFQGPEGQESLDAANLGPILEILPEPIKQLVLQKMANNEKMAEGKKVMYHFASAIPIATALGQSWNPAVAAECGDIVGEEMGLFGANVWLAPALNIQRSPLCGRNFEYYSEDPVISGKMAAAVTRAVQAHKGCAVTIKHFACNNQETCRVGSNSVVSRRALREIYLKGFEICVKEAAPLCVMSSYNLLNGIHTANRHDLLTDILRKEWGFGGIVMTDWGTTEGTFNTGKHGPADAALCVLAGNDLVMPGTENDVEQILRGLAEGKISRADLELCAGRVCALAEMIS